MDTQTPPAPAPQPTPAPEPPATPAVPASQPAVSAPAAQAQPASSDNKPKKILLVEDDDSLASVYTTRLQAEGFDTKRVPNGEDALSVAMQYRPDLILLDVMMPKVSGFDVLDIIRNTPEIGAVKVIMLTALSQDADKKRAEALGVDDYLVKSQVVIADVVDKIKHHLGLA
jgi:DNA-binding response OmpR family regulator